MNRTIKILFTLVAAATLLFSSCSKNGPTYAISDEYALEEDGLIINALKESTTDYPDASVKIKALDKNKVKVTLKNIILGYPEVDVNCSVIQTKGDKEYTFEGKYESSAIEVLLAGKVVNKKLSVDISFLKNSELIKKWMIGEKKVSFLVYNFILPDISISLTPPTGVTTIKIDGNEVLISEYINLLNTIIPVMAAQAPISYMEFTQRSTVSFGMKKIELASKVTPALPELEINNLLQFYEADGILYFYLRKSVGDLVNDNMKKEGGSVQIPSPYLFSTRYIINGKDKEAKLQLSLDQTLFNQYLLMVKGIVSIMTLEDYSMFNGENVSEKEFLEFKSELLSIINLLTDAQSKYKITFNLIPYIDEDRPWGNLNLNSTKKKLYSSQVASN